MQKFSIAKNWKYSPILNPGYPLDLETQNIPFAHQKGGILSEFGINNGFPRLGSMEIKPYLMISLRTEPQSLFLIDNSQKVGGEVFSNGNGAIGKNTRLPPFLAPGRARNAPWLCACQRFHLIPRLESGDECQERLRFIGFHTQVQTLVPPSDFCLH